MKTEQNVFVGISLQNKYLDRARVSEFLMVAKRDFKARNLCFLIADEIDFINRRVFSKDNENSIRRKVESRSLELTELIQQGLHTDNERDVRIHFCRWSDMLTAEMWDLTMQTEQLFSFNRDFRERISFIAKGYSENRTKPLSSYEEHYLCHYILAEIPVIVRGIDFDGLKFRSMVYPVPERFALDGVIDSLLSGDFGDFSYDGDRCQVVKV